LGCIFGVGALYGLLIFVKPWLESNFSIYLEVQSLSSKEWIYLLGIFSAGTLAGLIPAIKAYKNSLQDGLTIKY
jgi:putative ABC transport system permease protein